MSTARRDHRGSRGAGPGTDGTEETRDCGSEGSQIRRVCVSGEWSGDRVSRGRLRKAWIPAFAGMTSKWAQVHAETIPADRNASGSFPRRRESMPSAVGDADGISRLVEACTSIAASSL